MEDLGLTGSAIKEEKQPQKGGGGGGGERKNRHVVNVRGLLNNAIGDASAAISNVRSRCGGCGDGVRVVWVMVMVWVWVWCGSVV